MRALRTIEPWAQSALLLFARLYIARAFFSSGLTKLRDWDITIALFTDEYHVPLLSPAVAAALGTAAELGLPVLVALGLAQRFGAFGLFVFNIVAVISYPAGLSDAALQEHFYWGFMLAVLTIFGAGRFSVDAAFCAWRHRGGRTTAPTVRGP